MLNRIHNSRNPNQGEAKRVLCVCSAGLLRSPTTAVVLQREFGHNTRAAGMVPSFALIIVDDVLLNWAEQVVVMEPWMKQQIDAAGWSDKTICLNIPDSFEYMDKNLQELIKVKYLEEEEKIYGSQVPAPSL